jgi:hypothetical protein
VFVATGVQWVNVVEVSRMTVALAGPVRSA